jgi:hypothetical protein
MVNLTRRKALLVATAFLVSFGAGAVTATAKANRGFGPCTKCCCDSYSRPDGGGLPCANNGCGHYQSSHKD